MIRQSSRVTVEMAELYAIMKFEAFDVVKSDHIIDISQIGLMGSVYKMRHNELALVVDGQGFLSIVDVDGSGEVHVYDPMRSAKGIKHRRDLMFFAGKQGCAPTQKGIERTKVVKMCKLDMHSFNIHLTLAVMTHVVNCYSSKTAVGSIKFDEPALEAHTAKCIKEGKLLAYPEVDGAKRRQQLSKPKSNKKPEVWSEDVLKIHCFCNDPDISDVTNKLWIECSQERNRWFCNSCVKIPERYLKRILDKKGSSTGMVQTTIDRFMMKKEEKAAKKAKNKAWKCPYCLCKKLVTLPWHGRHDVPSRLRNTCPIDNILTCIFLECQDDDTFMDMWGHTDIENQLRSTINKFKLGDFEGGKADFVAFIDQKTGSNRSDKKQQVNVEDSEYNAIASHLYPIFSMSNIYHCTEGCKNDGRKKPDSLLAPRGTQEFAATFRKTKRAACKSCGSEVRCEESRLDRAGTTTRGQPWMIALDVQGYPTMDWAFQELPLTLVRDNKRYVLRLLTLYRPGHFVGLLNLTGFWAEYDGMGLDGNRDCRLRPLPDLAAFKQNMTDRPSFAVYVYLGEQ